MKVLMNLTVFVAFMFILSHPTSQDKIENKYSKESNVNYKEVKSPFRMGKLNLVWHKAQHKLSETKLKSFYTDLMAHDKEEIKLKRLTADGMDKEGLQEATIRKKFHELLSLYGLLGHFDTEAVPQKVKSKADKDREQNHINKSLFKDKKLNKLWEKAERSGFDQKELKLLKQEFQHHQEKIDEYYSVLEKVDDGNDRTNFVHLNEFEHLDQLDKAKLPSKKYPDGGLDNVNEIRTKHRDIKDGYDVLHKMVASGPDSQEFAEPRVANLWKMALNSDFTPEELDSIREELKHYEKRVEKLHHLHSEYLLKKVNADASAKDFHHTDKDIHSVFTDKLKRHERTVEKLHLDLETKILNRHNEL